MSQQVQHIQIPLLKKSPTENGATFLPDWSVQTDRTMEQPVQGLGAVHYRIRIRAFHALSRGVEQRPRIPGTEVLVVRLAPFLQHGGNLTWRDRLTIHRLDHEIVSLGMGDTTVPVAGDAFIDLEESLSQSTDRPRGEMPQVPLGEPRAGRSIVLPREKEHDAPP